MAERKIEDERRVVESGPQSPHVEIEDRLDRLFLSVIRPLDPLGGRELRDNTFRARIINQQVFVHPLKS